MKTTRTDQRGIAHVVLIVIIVAVLAGVGFAAYRVTQKKSANTAVNSDIAALVAADAESEKVCKQLYNDADLCKFASHALLTKASYKGTFTTKDKDGKTSTFEMSQDSKGNSSTVTKENGTESGAFISLNGDSYIKNEADGSWTKYPKSPDTASTPTTSSPTSDLKVDFKADETKPAAQRESYKKLGKEKCGNANCFKYQIIDPAQPGTESIVWFGDKDYLLHKWSFKDTDGSTNVGEFTYVAVTISAPSSVKDAPAVPSAAEIQQQLDAAAAAGGSED